MFRLVLCLWPKCYIRYKECENKTRNEKKGPKSISTIPPGAMESSPLPMIINPDLGSAVYGSSVPCDSSPLPPSPFSFLLTLYLLDAAKYVLDISKGEGEGIHEEAKSPPTQRMLITCVLSQAEPGHPLWIKGEIVSCFLIFHRPEMFGCSLSSSFCASEIIQVHSRQQNPSLSGCWTTSPWLH